MGTKLACYPSQFYYGMHFLSETPYGFWLSLAILTRPSLVLAVPVALLLAVVAKHPARPANLNRWLVQAVVVALALAPWIARNVWLWASRPFPPSAATDYGGHNELVLKNPDWRGLWIKISLLFE